MNGVAIVHFVEVALRLVKNSCLLSLGLSARLLVGCSTSTWSYSTNDSSSHR